MIVEYRYNDEMFEDGFDVVAEFRPTCGYTGSDDVIGGLGSVVDIEDFKIIEVYQGSEDIKHILDALEFDYERMEFIGENAAIETAKEEL